MREIDPRTFPTHILERAENLLERQFFSAALVMAQSACELASEQAIERWLASRGVDYLQECFESFVINYNMSRKQTRELYTALSGDHVERAAFWPEYPRMVSLRNLVVHRGAEVDADTASRYVGVARALVEHLGRVQDAVVRRPSVTPGADLNPSRETSTPSGTHALLPSLLGASLEREAR